ncbi:MAG: DUF4249 domain-containing protein [Bacteroidia bacterium]|nr:DUF4249 domain-containing protein [Bacteroidia bacterium]
MKASHIYCGLMMLWLLPSCTEPFSPKIDDAQHLVVVDGRLTNGPGPYVVKLALSANLTITNYDPISFAEVYIREEGGDRHLLEEVVAGEYHSDSASFRGEAGKSYRLEITLSNGKEYQSPYEFLRKGTKIDTVSVKPEIYYFDELQREIPGYQFYVSSEAADQGNDYFIWIMEGTYKYTADYPIYFVWRGFLADFPEPYAYYTCWRTYPVEEFVTANTTNLSEARVLDKPLFFLRGDDKKLSFRYSLLTRQLAVSKDAYEFWDGVRQQSASSTSLYNVQPYLLQGNMNNIEDSKEPVLGYFLVAGEEEQRIFVNKPTSFPVTYAQCGLDYDGYRWIFGEPSSSWPIYITIGDEGRAISGAGCLDCQQIGGKLSPPDWWIE